MRRKAVFLLAGDHSPRFPSSVHDRSTRVSDFLTLASPSMYLGPVLNLFFTDMYRRGLSSAHTAEMKQHKYLSNLFLLSNIRPGLIKPVDIS